MLKSGRSPALVSSSPWLQRSANEAQRMLKALGYLTSAPTGVMDRKSYAALSSFQSDNRLIATGELNYDTYERLKHKTRGLRANGWRKDDLSQGRYLEVSAPRKHKLGDPLIIKINTKNNGYLTCFHQSGTGAVTQILPQDPDTRFHIRKNQSRILPDSQDKFAVRFDNHNTAERVLCTLQNSDAHPNLLFDKLYKPFAKLPVKDIKSIPKQFKANAHLKDWVMITRRASP